MLNDIKAVPWQDWETVQLIGRGSFGSVYKIKHNVFGETETAALKVISIPQNNYDIEELYNEGYDKENVTNAFQNHLKSIISEYTLMRKLSSCSNIVNCDDIKYTQHDDGIGWDIFIKMELLTPLTKSLPSSAIPEEIVVKIATDMCNALEACKEHNIVHRDIKPQNIFVSDAGNYKLGDFGVAKTIEKTVSGTKIGTYKYMAPEIYNNQPYGSSSDIYSLGLVLYWLLNDKRLPFLPPSPEKIKAGMEEDARKRRFAGEPLPEPMHGSKTLKSIVLKACAFDPANRYSSPSQLLNALKLLDTVKVSQKPTSSISVCPLLIRLSNNEVIPLDKAFFRIGRHSSCVDYALANNALISRHHINITNLNGNFFVCDLGSRNKTYINNKIIPPNVKVPIFHQNILRLANEDFVFLIVPHEYPTLIRLINKEFIQLTKPIFSIGRDASCVDYALTGNTLVSRHHINIISRDDGLFVYDLGSTNKTCVNGRTIAPNVEVPILNYNILKLAHEEFFLLI